MTISMNRDAIRLLSWFMNISEGNVWILNQLCKGNCEKVNFEKLMYFPSLNIYLGWRSTSISYVGCNHLWKTQHSNMTLQCVVFAKKIFANFFQRMESISTTFKVYCNLKQHHFTAVLQSRFGKHYSKCTNVCTWFTRSWTSLWRSIQIPKNLQF